MSARIQFQQRGASKSHVRPQSPKAAIGSACFPVPYRFLEKEERFKKYQWVEVVVEKASDTRPESYKLISTEPIKILSEVLPTSNGWRVRKKIVSPLMAHCLCCLKKERDENEYPTLGFFRPRSIDRLVIEDDSPQWSEGQLAALRQKHLFDEGPEEELEKIPYRFRYQFQCDHDVCEGHTLICTDWELGQSWRNWRTRYRDNWEAKLRTAIRNRYDPEVRHSFLRRNGASVSVDVDHCWALLPSQNRW